jgi:hypothetical protein
VAEFNTPHPVDADGEYLLYDEFGIGVISLLLSPILEVFSVDQAKANIWTIHTK